MFPSPLGEFVALTFCSAAEGAGLLTRAAGGFSQSARSTMSLSTTSSGRLVVAWSGATTPLESGWVAPLVTSCFSTTGARLGISELRRVCALGTAEVMPPFGVVHFDDRAEELVTAVDALGLQHVYHASRPGRWAAVSSSAPALARLLGRGLDVPAYAVYAQLGHFLEGQSGFEGVQKLGPGQRIVLKAGQARVLAPSDVAETKPTGDVTSSVREGVAAIREAAAVCTRAAMSPRLLEMSGGLDSRVMLAALPEMSLRSTTAITLVGSGDDAIIAQQLLAQRPLAALTLPMRLLRSSTTDLLSAARSRNFQGNSLGYAIFDAVAEHVGTGPRLSGQNGEFVRGFYYSGLSAPPRTSEEVLRRARKKMTKNEAVPAALLHPTLRARQESYLLESLQAAGLGRGASLEHTDEFYLRGRIQRWVGPAVTHAAAHRQVLLPFTHPRFLAWARGCKPHVKRNSRVLAAVLAELSPDLARVPLSDGRPPPSVLAQGGRAAVVGESMRLGRGLLERVGSRVRPARPTKQNDPAEGGLLSRLLHATGPALQQAVDAEILDSKSADALLAGQQVSVSHTSLAYLVNVLGALEALSDE